MYSYDRTAAIDASVLGYTEAELEAMDDEERQEVLGELLAQASDLAVEISKAFKKDLGSHSQDVNKAGQALNRIYRSIR